VETLAQENGGRVVYDHIYAAYKEYIELTMTKHLEATLFSDQRRRPRGETLISYTACRQILFRYLENNGISLPSDAKGYLLMRDSKVSAQAWDTVTTWTRNSYDYEVIIESLRRLERPIPGQGGHIVTNLGAFVEEVAFSGMTGYTDPGEQFAESAVQRTIMITNLQRFISTTRYFPPPKVSTTAKPKMMSHNTISPTLTAVTLLMTSPLTPASMKTPRLPSVQTTAKCKEVCESGSLAEASSALT
jgi:hypothetical protein